MEYIVNDMNPSAGTGTLTPLFVGKEQCKSGHEFGPFVRAYYLIHFCLSGKGVLRDKYGEHKISAGELFVIRPGEITVYTADQQNPWDYRWIAFEGERARIFDSENSVYRYPVEMAKRLFACIERGETAAECYIAFLYELIYHLFSKNDNTRATNDKLAKIHQYIEYNYMQDLRVSALSRAFGFERSYLYRIFKQRFGIGVKEYITQVRMERAENFLKSGHSVCDTAHMVGYEDVFHFSKSYKTYFGITPSKTEKVDRYNENA